MWDYNNFKHIHCKYVSYGVFYDILVRWPQHAKFHAIPSGHSPQKARKPQILPLSLSQSCAKIREIKRLWPKSIQFWRWSGYISMPNFMSFLQVILHSGVDIQIPSVSLSLSQSCAKMKLNIIWYEDIWRYCIFGSVYTSSIGDLWPVEESLKILFQQMTCSTR